MAANAPSITALLQKSSLDDDEEILKASIAALRKSKSDVIAQHVRVVALLKLDRYDEALHLFESSGKSLQEKAPLEYAYSLYKGGKPKEAAEVAAGLKDRRGSMHVEAQACYRVEEFSQTADLYRELSSTEPSTEKNDLRINQGAVEAQLIWSSKRALDGFRKPDREDLEAFETAYNAGCNSIAKGELRQAGIILRRAKELCKHSDELSQEEKAAELLPINVQQLYLFERLRNFDEARAIASEMKAEEILDIATRHIAQHNLLIASEQPPNPYTTHKLLYTSSRYSSSDKPFTFQQRILDTNRRIGDLQAMKFDGVVRSTTRILKSGRNPSPSSDFASVGVLNAAAHARGEDGKPALQHLLPELERSPYNLGLLLTLVQIYVSINDSTSAIDLLESFSARLEQSSFEEKGDVRFSPGLVAVAAALYRSQGRRCHATLELERAASYWRQTSNPPTALLQAAGAALLEFPNLEDTTSAAEIFTVLHKEKPEDKAAAAGYIAAYVGNDLMKVKAEVEQLTPVSQLIRGINVDDLEKAGIPQSSNALAIAQKTGSRKRGSTEQASNKPKRLRKSRLPKDYDPSKAPDPERWLPLRDRSTYRPKGKKGKKKDADRTQGGIVADDVGVKDGVLPARPSGGGVVGSSKRNKKKGKR